MPGRSALGHTGAPVSAITFFTTTESQHSGEIAVVVRARTCLHRVVCAKLAAQRLDFSVTSRSPPSFRSPRPRCRDMWLGRLRPMRGLFPAVYSCVGAHVLVGLRDRGGAIGRLLAAVRPEQQSWNSA
jgi:hypothetical protein